MKFYREATEYEKKEGFSCCFKIFKNGEIQKCGNALYGFKGRSKEYPLCETHYKYAKGLNI